MAVKGKNYLILIYAILKKHATQAKPLSAHDIQKLISEYMGDDQSIDIRTIRSHLETLVEEFIDSPLIEECCKTDKDKYFFTSPIDETQIRLIADVIAASNYLSIKQSQQLIKQFYELNMTEVPDFYRSAIKYKKHTNPAVQVFYTVEIISKAIESKKKVSCVYMEYDLNQKLVPKNLGAKRVLNIFEIIWTANHYYALCMFEDTNRVYFLRIDKMNGVEIVDEDVAPLPADFDISNYLTTQPHLFGGKVRSISFEIKKSALDQVVDSFGKAAKLSLKEEGYVKVELLSSIETMKVWLIQYCTVVRKIYPPQLQQMVLDGLESAILEIDEKYNLN